MALPSRFAGRLKIPAVAAPMFLLSGPDLVVNTCISGVLGTFPALNQRSTQGYIDWLQEIQERLAPHGDQAAPFGVNLIVHGSNSRLEADLKATVANKVPLVITSLGAVGEVVDAVHSYGGLVFHDVISVRHAKKAIAAGVDGIIAVTAGAGGHAGTLNPFALIPEIRRIFDGTLLLAGALSTGAHIAAARLLGADMAYMGTRFINTQESLASKANKQMITEAQAADIVYTAAVSGIPGNFLAQSLIAQGIDPKTLSSTPEQFEFSKDEVKAWKTIWSAGQGVGSVQDIPPVAELCARLIKEYDDACTALK